MGQDNATLCRKFGKRSCIYRRERRGGHFRSVGGVSFVKVEWALKHAHTNRRRLNDKQKNYLIQLFLFGEKTGRKAYASEVSKTTRKARNEDGSLLFQSDEYLTSLQIASFFSRVAAKKSVLVSLSTSDLANQDYCDDFLSAMAEKELDEMSQEVGNDLSIQHPITIQSYNICETAATSKLSKFSIAMLEEICKNFELDTSTIKQRREKPTLICWMLT